LTAEHLENPVSDSFLLGWTFNILLGHVTDAMAHSCAGCGDTLDGDQVRYERRGESTDVDRFCSLNCLTGTTDHDESAVRERLFEQGLESTV
jgi:hypothetical protein